MQSPCLSEPWEARGRGGRLSRSWRSEETPKWQTAAGRQRSLGATDYQRPHSLQPAGGIVLTRRKNGAKPSRGCAWRTSALDRDKKWHPLNMAAKVPLRGMRKDIWIKIPSNSKTSICHFIYILRWIYSVTTELEIRTITPMITLSRCYYEWEATSGGKTPNKLRYAFILIRRQTIRQYNIQGSPYVPVEAKPPWSIPELA